MPCPACARLLALGEQVCMPCRVDADTRYLRITQTEWAFEAFLNYLRFRRMQGR